VRWVWLGPTTREANDAQRRMGGGTGRPIRGVNVAWVVTRFCGVDPFAGWFGSGARRLGGRRPTDFPPGQQPNQYIGPPCRWCFLPFVFAPRPV